MPHRARARARSRSWARLARGASRVRMLVVPNLQRLLRDLDLEVLVLDDALTAEAATGTHVEAHVESILFFVAHLFEAVAALADVAVARRARTHATARAPHLHA